MVGCGSSVTVHEGNGDGGSGASGSGSGSTGVSSGAGAGSPGCECATTEVCYEGECFAERMILAGILQLASTGHGTVSTREWASQAEWDYDLLAEAGACKLLKPDDAGHAGYAIVTFDVGQAGMQVDDGDVMGLSSFMGGRAQTPLPLTFDDDTGGAEVTVSLSGGADAPAVSASVVTGPPMVVPSVPTLTPGQPWTVTWDAIEPPDTLSMTGIGDGHQLDCSVEGSSVTIDASLTSMITTTNDSVDAWFIREDDSQKVDAGNGVILRAVAFRWEPFSVPLAP